MGEPSARGIARDGGVSIFDRGSAGYLQYARHRTVVALAVERAEPGSDPLRFAVFTADMGDRREGARQRDHAGVFSRFPARASYGGTERNGRRRPRRRKASEESEGAERQIGRGDRL